MLTFESTETMFPGPLAEAMGCLSGTSTGDTKTDSFSPSSESMAVPSSLMVERIILAYSKSTDVRDEMPLHWICAHMYEFATILYTCVSSYIGSRIGHLHGNHPQKKTESLNVGRPFTAVNVRRCYRRVYWDRASVSCEARLHYTLSASA